MITELCLRLALAASGVIRITRLMRFSACDGAVCFLPREDPLPALRNYLVTSKLHIRSLHAPSNLIGVHSKMSGVEAVAAIELIDACVGIANTIIDISCAVNSAYIIITTL